MDFSFDSDTYISFEGKTEKIRLATSIGLAYYLLAQSKPFSVKSYSGEIYIEYDGSSVFSDSRVKSIIEEFSLVFRID